MIINMKINIMINIITYSSINGKLTTTTNAIVNVA